jgi:hypothetical protein
MTMAALWTPRATFWALSFCLLSALSAGSAFTSSPQGNSAWPDARPVLAESPDISATSQTAVRPSYLTGEVVQTAGNGSAYPRALAVGKTLALAIPFGVGILSSPNGIRSGIGK